MKRYSYEFYTPFGTFRLRATAKGLYSLETAVPAARSRKNESRRGLAGIHSLLRQAAREIRFYLAGRRVDFRRFPLDWTGLSPFGQCVLRELRKIPWGRTESYQFLAEKAGRPRGARSVGRVLHLNRLPLVVPCHRIVPKKGGVGGFSRGVRWKKRLLKLESGSVDTKGRSRRPRDGSI